MQDDERFAFAHGGADALSVFCSAPLRIDEDGFVAEGRLAEGERLYAAVTHEESFSHKTDHVHEDEIDRALDETLHYWREWAGRAAYEGEFRDEVVRSALTLKALTYQPTGAIVAAATTSLPEAIGGERNWDYRYTWIRDATLALYALGILGYREEAKAFNGWLEWSTLGRASDLQPLYGIGGERRLTEMVLDDLSGYRDSAPVRIGNGAYTQFQLDVFGELLDSAHQFRKHGGEIGDAYWQHLRRIVEHVIERWREPDEGIWETRGGRKHFVLSKVMCWVALDRAIKAARALRLTGDIERWRGVRAEIRADIERHGYDEERGAFVQSYGSKNLDASNLLLPLVGFIKPSDVRMRGTIEATARELTSAQGFVYRYRDFDDGLTGTEGTFLICTFWLADNSAMLGDIDRARELFDLARGLRERPGVARRGVRRGDGRDPRQFSPGVQSPGADQHGGATRARPPGASHRCARRRHRDRVTFRYGEEVHVPRLRRIVHGAGGGAREVSRLDATAVQRLPSWRAAEEV